MAHKINPLGESSEQKTSLRNKPSDGNLFIPFLCFTVPIAFLLYLNMHFINNDPVSREKARETLEQGSFRQITGIRRK